MRAIKFRGKRIDNGEWIYGDLLHGSYKQDGSMWIRYFNEKHQGYYSEKVHIDTVGQFVGILDNEGKDIYEGDIICFADGYTDCAGDGVETVSIGEVKFDEDQCCFYTTNRISIDAGEVWEYLDELKVIGNIHQTTELLNN